jgi:hypothetical protein
MNFGLSKGTHMIKEYLLAMIIISESSLISFMFKSNWYLRVFRSSWHKSRPGMHLQVNAYKAKSKKGECLLASRGQPWENL